jgi:N,N-dimethylformamidase
MRPRFRYRTWAAPARFPADLYLVDWLDHEGIEVDFITDHDLQAEGASLLEPYSVVVSSSHHEYWSGRMLDALSGYLDSGGRFMYLGGNSLFGVASFDPDPAKPHKVEVRRWGAPWPFEVPPAERRHSTTGEQGGTWRNRGRPPNGIVAVGTSGAGFDVCVPYKRMPDSFDPRVRFIFEGIGDDELIGDQPSLQVKWGAAGYEFDRFDLELGSPPTTLLLASSVGFSDAYHPMIDEVLWYVPGRDGMLPDDPQDPGGEPHRYVRSDMTYLEYPNGGAVFSVGSIAWRGGISHNDYDNTVARITGNVLRRFADRPKGESPSDHDR